MKEKLVQKFLEKAKTKFGDKFDYSKVEYVDSKTPVVIICPIHGEFEITPVRFLQNKHGCRKCSIEHTHKLQTKTTEQFVKECKEIWGNAYSYENTNYINADTKVLINCPIHGEFLTRPADFVRGHGCSKCKSLSTIKFNKKTKSDTLETFITKSTLLYDNLFDYSKVLYVNSRTKVLIHSNLLNEDFLITPAKFLQGQFKQKYLNLPKNKASSLTKEIIIQRALLVHGNKYLYDKVVYKDLHTPILITCPKHGDFLQTPINHLWNREGCPICNNSKGEMFIDNTLNELNIDYKRQYAITYNNSKMYVDFCVLINNQKIFIEYNGRQHYEPVEVFGGVEKFKKQQERDLLLEKYCDEHNIILLTYKYDIPFDVLANLIKTNLNEIKDRS